MVAHGGGAGARWRRPQCREYGILSKSGETRLQMALLVLTRFFFAQRGEKSNKCKTRVIINAADGSALPTGPPGLLGKLIQLKKPLRKQKKISSSYF